MFDALREGENDMHNRRWGIQGLIIAIGIISLSGGGCSCHRTGQGWILQPGWSLEFKRAQFSCGRAAECTGECAAQVPKVPDCASANDKESEVLHEANPTDLEKLNNSPFARLMERRGRLGICASCGRLGRFNEPVAAEQAPMPVIAKFHPVPTQPVFCPREETMQAVSSDPTPKQKEKERGATASSKKSQPKAPMPEEIPAPPVVSDVDKSAAAVPRQLDVPREPSSWIFSPPPETKPEKLIEAQLPPRPSERAALR